jgi:O-antigen/teichoic acid export membrane protein
MSGQTALLRRLSLGVVDQLLSSGSNFVALLLGARYLSVTGFGDFSLAMLSFTLTLGIARALCSEAMLVRPGSGPDEHRRRNREATGAVVWVGLVAGAVFASTAIASSGSLARCFAVLAVLIPGLLVQDTLRYAAFARGAPRAALESDLMWFVVQMVAMVALISATAPTGPQMLAAFALPGLLAGLVQAVRERVVPSVRSGASWILRNRDLSVRYALDFLSGQGAAQVGAYVLAIVSGVAALGSIRGGQTLFGPVNIFLTGAYIVLVPEGRHAARRSKRSLTMMCGASSAAFALFAAAMLGAFLVLSTSQGEMILGSTWVGARSVIVPVGIAAIAGGVLAGPSTGLRALSAAKIILRIRLVTIPTTVALPIAGAVLGGAEGLAWGIAASVWWNTGWYWGGYFRALHGFDPASVVDDPLDRRPSEAVPALSPRSSPPPPSR